ncbi:hypothetical protein E2C01_063756 [Portunus trituberculatus]|uniref:Uncharacterized protein n=1 Tax=Portunus trituberculatus TaxID=210409 RepID=A0A5B7HBC0_PORTR|nr:hypothetical protein [Portunus trituberculatus]
MYKPVSDVIEGATRRSTLALTGPESLVFVLALQMSPPGTCLRGVQGHVLVVTPSLYRLKGANTHSGTLLAL